jgi:hypothetical protein
MWREVPQFENQRRGFLMTREIAFVLLALAAANGGMFWLAAYLDRQEAAYS